MKSPKEFTDFKQVIDHFPEAVLITKEDGSIIYVNKAWEKLTGYKLKEVKGRNPRLLQSGKTERKVFKKMWTTLLAGKNFHSEDVINKRKDGKEYQIHSTIFPIKHNKKTLFYVQIEDDITKRKQLEELKNAFLSTAIHELRTPITSLKLLIQHLIKQPYHQNHSSKAINDFQMINRELTRLSKLIEDLSNVSRIENNKLKLNLEVANLASLITDVVNQTKIMTQDHEIVFKPLPRTNVIIDSDRITQVLLNLITNAIKYSPPNTRIQILVHKDKKSVVVSVKDQGIGIPKEKQNWIFNKFYQAHKLKSGLGLGLYIASEIIKQHGGKIWVDSEDKKGSTFSFTLKLAKSHTS